MNQNIEYNIEKHLSNKRILVIGDVMIDAYLFGSVDRISPEAPVPIVNLNKRVSRLGGAANVALNIQSLGATPILCSVIGDDDKGDEFLELMNSLNLPTDAMIKSAERITTVKFRVIGNNTQLIRVDEEIDTPLSEKNQQQLLLKIFMLIDSLPIDAIIFEDYDKGVLTATLIEAIITKARNNNIPVAVDPKKRNFNNYHHCTIFKPNLKELKEGTKASIDFLNIDEVASLAHQYIVDQEIDIAMITMSEKGVLVVRKDSGAEIKTLIPAHFRNIVDVSGAGDTVISVASLFYTLGFPFEEVAAVANLAGGLVCEEVGVIPIAKNKLLSEIDRLHLIETKNNS